MRWCNEEPLTQLFLTTNQRNPDASIAGNTGNVVCNTSFTNFRTAGEDGNGQGRRSAQHKRNKALSGQLCRTKWKNLTGTARWSNGTNGLLLFWPDWTRWKPGGRRSHKKRRRRRTIKTVCKNPATPSKPSLYTQRFPTATILQLQTQQSSSAQETTLSCEEFRVQNCSCSHGAAT